MPAIQINDAEWGLLMGEPAELLKLYVALKRRMDFATGIAGRKTLINEIVLREGFNVDPIPGRPKPPPITREKYRSAVRRLEKVGLLVTLGPLVFEFPYARRDSPSKTATTELQPEPQPQQQPPQEPLNPSDYGVYSDSVAEQQPAQEPQHPASYNLLPESVLPSLPPSSSNAREDIEQAASRQRFAMHDGWEPTPKGWGAMCLRNGIPPTALDAGVLLEFRSYWIERPDKFQSQGQWEHELAQRVKRAIRHNESRTGGNHAQRHATPAGGPRATGQQDHPLGSLRDELCDTSWAERLNIPHD